MKPLALVLVGVQLHLQLLPVLLFESFLGSCRFPVLVCSEILKLFNLPFHGHLLYLPFVFCELLLSFKLINRLFFASAGRRT